MNGAILIMLLTSLPIMYYYYTMYYVNEKTRYLIGLLAGAWTFIGVFLVTAGIIRFWYYIILVLLVIFVYIFEKIMGYLDENFEEGEKEEYEIEWPVDVSNMVMAFMVLFLIIIMYFGFFLVAVSPARADNPGNFDEEEGDYKNLPNAYMYEYKNALSQSYVVIITMRMVPISQGMIESALDYAKPEVEEYIKEKYDQDAELELREKEDVEIDGHDAAQHTYDVRWQTTFGSRSAVMVLQAFYYHEDMETIIIGYVYPPDGESVTATLLESIEF